MALLLQGVGSVEAIDTTDIALNFAIPSRCGDRYRSTVFLSMRLRISHIHTDQIDRRRITGAHHLAAQRHSWS